MGEFCSGAGASVLSSIGAMGNESSRPRDIAARSRVLIVDDNPEVTYVLSESLISFGYAVQTAAGGKEALEIFAATRPALVLLDLRMPLMNGVEVFRELRRVDDRVPVIVVTALTDEALARSLLRDGAFDFVSKPVDHAYLGLTAAAATGNPWPVIAKEMGDDAVLERKSTTLKIAYGVMALCRRLDGPPNERGRLETLAHRALRFALSGRSEPALACLHAMQRDLDDGGLAWMLPDDAHALTVELALLPPQAGRELRGVRVLLVDDEADSREVMGVALELAGATVTLATTAEDALYVLKSGLPHVIVSDIAMPGRDGYWLTREAKAMAVDAKLPTLAVTGFRNQDRSRALESGFDDWVMKPVDPVELCRRVATLVTD